MTQSLYFQFAKTPYGGNAYGADAYGANQTEATTGRSEPDSVTGSGLLASTGYDVLIPLAIGTIMILAALAMIIKMALSKRKSKRT